MYKLVNVVVNSNVPELLDRGTFDNNYEPFYPVCRTKDGLSSLSPYWETYDYELDVVMAYADKFPKRVLTLIDSDESESGLVMVSGYHLVNRVGYILTKLDYNSEQSVEY